MRQKRDSRKSATPVFLRLLLDRFQVGYLSVDGRIPLFFQPKQTYILLKVPRNSNANLHHPDLSDSLGKSADMGSLGT
jgi:hypothetical protein